MGPNISAKCFKEAGFYLKCVELIISILCTTLIVLAIRNADIRPSHLHHFTLIFTTFNSYIIILGVLVVARILGDHISYKMSYMFSLIGAGLFLASGCLILSDRVYYSRNYIFHPHLYLLDMMSTAGVFAMVNSIVFALDGIFTFKMQSSI